METDKGVCHLGWSAYITIVVCGIERSLFCANLVLPGSVCPSDRETAQGWRDIF